MCKAGDIIVVNKYCDAGNELTRHSFIVLNDESGQIQGLDYDFVCNVMSSFKNEEQRKRKMSYPGNFELKNIDKDVAGGNNKSGYVKAEQFYYFNKEKLDYILIGQVKEEIFNQLIEFIENLEMPIIHITENL